MTRPTVVLIGPPGAPVRAVGELVANALSIDFHDSDDEITHTTGKPADELLIDDGEDAYRAAERRAVQQLLTRDGVLVLGGGAVLAHDTERDLTSLSAAGVPVAFVDTNLPEAARVLRLNMSHATPLINPRTQWLRQYQHRRPVYERVSTLVVVADGREPAALAAEVLTHLRQE